MSAVWRFLVANVVYSNRGPVVLDALDKLIEAHDPDAMVLVETKNVDLTQLDDGWRVHQGRAYDLARRNAAVAWRHPLHAGRRRFIFGTDAVGLLDRYITRARLHDAVSPRVAVDAMHLAPGRVDSANRAYERSVEAHARNRWKLWAGDMNESRIPEVALQYGLQFRRVGVMFVATNLPIRRFRLEHVRVFDHAVLVVDVEAPA